MIETVKQCPMLRLCRTTDEYKQRSDMEREIWEVIKALDEKKLTAIEAHKKICDLYIISGSSLLNQCLKEQEEIVSSPIRFNGIHINKLKQVFLKNGIEADELGF